MLDNAKQWKTSFIRRSLQVILLERIRGIRLMRDCKKCSKKTVHEKTLWQLKCRACWTKVNLRVTPG